MHARALVILASLLLALAVVTGAFGAHGLKTRVTPEAVAIWQTAVLYHLVHGLGLLAIAASAPWLHARLLRWVSGTLLLGTVLFSGSLYLLALTNTPALGAVTPFGGAALIAGWVLLALAAWRASTPSPVRKD